MFASLFEIIIHIPACAGRRKENGIPRLRSRKRNLYAFVHIPAEHIITVSEVLSRICDNFSVTSYQHKFLDLAVKILNQFVKLLALAVTACNQNNVAFNRPECDNCRIDIGAFGIVIEFYSIKLAGEFNSVFNSSE